MLKSIGKPALLIKLGVWRCMCLRRKSLDDGLRSRVRPFDFLGFSCWCDKADE